MLILAMEASTTSAKAMLYSTESGVVQMRTEPYRQLRYGTTAIQDPGEQYAQVTALARRVAGGRKVDLVTVSTTWQSLLLCDRDMTPASPIYLWNHSAAQPVTDRILQDPALADSLYRRTGAIVNPSYPSFKLLWLKSQGMDLSRYRILGNGSYLTWRLTGQEAVMDSMASGSGLFHIQTRNWDAALLEQLGVSPEAFFPIVPYTHRMGLSPQGAADLGLAEGTPVLPAGSDGGLDQLGAGALRPGAMTLSAGTSGSLRFSTPGRPRMSAVPGTWCYLSPKGDWLSGIGTSGCCNCIDWARAFFFQSEPYAQIEQRLTPMPEAPIFLPFLFGERGPEWRSRRQGGFQEIRGSHRKEDFYYSVLEGTLFNLYQCYQLLCETNGTTPSVIKISGGILNSPLWRQMCVDLFGQEMEIVEEKHSSLFGAVVMGLDAAGLVDAAGDLHELNRPEPKRLTPGYSGDYYRRRYQRYLHYFGSL